MDYSFTTIGALIGMAVAIILIIKKVQPAYSLILGALIGGVIGSGNLILTVDTMVSGAQSMISSVLRIMTSGILAGTPADCSATYAPLPEVTGVDTIEDADAAINSGKLILINDGRQVKLGRAVTSKTMVADDETQALKKIKMVAAVDLIRYYALTTIEDNYQGKCSNTYDNKCILLTALRGYLKELENGDVLLEKSSGAELDAAAIRAFLIDQASKAGDVEEANRIKALDDAAVVKEDTGSHVFIRLFGYVLDAMEDFAVVLEVSNGLLAM